MENLDYEAKIQILKEICNNEELILDDNLLNLIAQKQLNKDDLLDIVIKAKALAKIEETTITEEIIEKSIILNEMYKKQEKMLIDIKATVEQYFNVNLTNYNIKDRKIKNIRNIAIYLMREIGDIYCVQIANKFNIDSPLVLRIHQNMKEKITKDDNTKKIIEELTAIIKKEV